MRCDNGGQSLSDGPAVFDVDDIAGAHLAARAVQRRIIAICALCALIAVALLAAAIVTAETAIPGVESIGATTPAGSIRQI